MSPEDAPANSNTSRDRTRFLIFKRLHHVVISQSWEAVPPAIAGVMFKV